MIGRLFSWLFSRRQRENPYTVYYVTDLDRIYGGIHSSEKRAIEEAERLAAAFPGNAIHVLKTIHVARRDR